MTARYRGEFELVDYSCCVTSVFVVMYSWSGCIRLALHLDRVWCSLPHTEYRYLAGISNTTYLLPKAGNNAWKEILCAPWNHSPLRSEGSKCCLESLPSYSDSRSWDIC